jgi:hypothetical protein
MHKGDGNIVLGLRKGIKGDGGWHTEESSDIVLHPGAMHEGEGNIMLHARGDGG